MSAKEFSSEIQPAIDPVLPDQGGRMTKSDPEQVFPVTEDELRRRAYQIFEERGRGEGNALNDWLAAEAEVHHSPQLSKSEAQGNRSLTFL